jgi:hypothetical protein
MSQRLVSLNEDLSRLRAAGYDVVIGKSNHLLVRDVPYVNADKQVKRGIIASDLDLAGEATIPPKSHVVFFIGEYPCNVEGSLIGGVSPNTNQALGEGLTPNHQISRRPKLNGSYRDYTDYFEKITTLVSIVSGPAEVIEPGATARTYPVVVPDEGESVFHYLDTASTKAGIVMANRQLEGKKIGIVGVGGTGSYVLDFVAKTPVAEIHIFDGDIFLNHNAFRCPGAASLEELKGKPQKVAYLAAQYGRMRRQIVPHEGFVKEENIEVLKEMDFVFLCIDDGDSKQFIVEQLESWGISFINVGMGIQVGDDNKIAGVVTATTSTATKRDHFRARVSLGGHENKNEYSRNVQIAELNALNAAVAVIKWKKLFGYYDDTTKEHFAAYTIRSNQLISEDIHEV